MKNGRPQAKDLDDRLVLATIWRLQMTPYAPHPWGIKTTCPHWATRWETAEALEAAGVVVPEKVLLAKAASLIRRNLMHGCTCGCRGDFELTLEGGDLIGVQSAGLR